jgi:hypothetical protein
MIFISLLRDALLFISQTRWMLQYEIGIMAFLVF